MAAKPIELEFIADVAQYLRAVKDVEVSTEDIGEALVAVSNDSKDLERKLDKAMKSAERDTESLERAIDGLGDTTAKETRNMSRDFDDFSDDTARVGAEAGDEFQQNLGESIASGDVSGILQDTLGGLTATLKGWQGLAIGAIAGVAIFGFQKLTEQMQAWQDAVDSASQSMVDAVVEAQGRLTDAASTAAAAAWIQDNEEGWNQIKALAEEAGINAEDYVFNMFDGAEGAEKNRVLLSGIVTEGKEVVKQGDRMRVKYDDSASAASKLRDMSSQVGGALQEAVVYAQDLASANERAAAAAERTASAHRNDPGAPGARQSPAVYPSSGVTK